MTRAYPFAPTVKDHIGNIFKKSKAQKSSNRFLNRMKEAPSGWMNSMPNNFLTIEKTGFGFSLALKKKEKDRELLDHTVNWLKKGLQEHGVGAKTSVGYGYFKI